MGIHAGEIVLTGGANSNKYYLLHPSHTGRENVE
jgi:hypothetical protein